MRTTYQWMIHEFVPAFCRMLLHSLWLGVVSALLAGIIIAATKKTSAASRYNWLVLLFSATILAAGVLFFYELQSAPSLTRSASPSSVITEGSLIYISDSPITVGATKTSLFNSVVQFLDKNAAAIMLVWFFVFLFKLVRIGFGLRHIQIIQHRKIHAADEEWIQWINAKSRELGIKKAIVFLQSEMTRIPITVGHLKPVILVPLGLLSQLSPQQVESILLHELAHIRRRDYLVNLAQSFTDAIFFFNPAMLWLSALIRQEREKCCDDIVMQHSDRTDYLEALVSFQEIQFNGRYAMGLHSRKNSLLNRVKRMLTRENTKLTRGELSFLLIGILVIGFSFMAFRPKVEKLILPEHTISGNVASPEKTNEPTPSSVAVKKKNTIAPKPVVQQTIKDTVPSTIDEKKTPVKFKEIISNMSDDGTNSIYQTQATTTDGTVYKIRREQNVIVSFFVNGKEVPKEEYSQYDPIMQTILQEQKARSLKAQNSQQMRLNAIKIQQAQLNKKLATMNEERRLQFEKSKLIKQDSIKKIAGRAKFQPNVKKEMTPFKTKPDRVFRSSSNSTMSLIIRDLMDMKIITSEDPLSFSLTYKEFVVNGVVQSGEILEKFRTKYVKDPDNHFSYSKTGGSTRSDIYLK